MSKRKTGRTRKDFTVKHPKIGGRYGGRYDLRFDDGKEHSVVVSYQCLCPGPCMVHGGTKGGK